MHCLVRGVALALCCALMLGQAGAQDDGERYYDKYEVPPDYRPLAVAYLAAPWPDGRAFAGPTKEFMRALTPPGTSISAKFLEKKADEPWAGIPLGLFKGQPGHATRLTIVGSGDLAVGGDGNRALAINLYAFVPESQNRNIFSIMTFDSDAWKKNPQRFSVLTDTMFALNRLDLSLDLPAFKPPVVACVNKRSLPPVCLPDRDDKGEIIEDPFTGQPALLMLGRNSDDMPSPTLRAVRTEICALREKNLAVFVPDARGPIVLDQADGERWCSRTLTLDYYALRAEGLRIGSLAPRKRLDSRFAPDRDWRMWAGLPRMERSKGQDDWVQRIVLHLPNSKEAGFTQAAPAIAPGPPVDVLFQSKDVAAAARLKHAKVPNDAGEFLDVDRNELRFTLPPELIVTACSVLKLPLDCQIDGQGIELLPRAGAPLSKNTRTITVDVAFSAKTAAPPSQPVPTQKAVPSVPSGPAITLVFTSSTNAAATGQLKHVGAVPNEDGGFLNVSRQQLRFTLPRESGLVIAKCETPRLDCRFDAQSIELLPKAGEAMPKVARVEVAFDQRREADLAFAANGPAPIRIQQVSAGGKLTDLARLMKSSTGASSALEKTVLWKPGDKLRVSIDDPLLYKLQSVRADQKSEALKSDTEVEIPIADTLKAIAVATDERRFAGPLTVTARGGKVAVMLGEKAIGTVEEGAPRLLAVEGARPGDTLTVRPVNPEYELARIKLNDGQKARDIETPAPSFTVRLDRSALRPGDKLAALSLEADLREIPVLVPTDIVLKPAMRLGKRLLALQSCKVTLTGLDATYVYKSDGSTSASFGAERRVPKSASYPVALSQGDICKGLTAEAPFAAAKFQGLRKGASITVPVTRPGGRALVGIVSLPRVLLSMPQSWQAALEAFSEAFDAGAKDGRYLWAALYGPDGKRLIKTTTADYALLDIEREVLKSAATMGRLQSGKALPFEALLGTVIGEVADLEGSVDLLIAAEPIRATCGLFDPRLPPGGRTALVQFAGVPGTQGMEEMSGVRVCEPGDKPGVVAEVEVVPGVWKLGDEPDKLLKRVLAQAAARLATR